MPISGRTFRNLRIFHLDFMGSPRYQVLVPKLFTDLPLLEELSIRARLWSTDGQTTFNIIAPALKIFVFTTVCTFPDIYDVKVVIDAPLLEKICLVEDCISSYSFKNCPNISEAKICVGKHRVADFFDRGNESDASYYNLRAREILRAVSNAKHISLSSRAVLALLILPQIDLPLLPFLTKLELVIPCACAWKLLLPMLENSPNLEVLILTKMEYVSRNGGLLSLRQESLLADLIGGFEFIPPENLPTCLLLHLKDIEIRRVKKIEKVKVLEYVVKNAKVLKKLTVHPVRTTIHEIVALARFDGLQSFVM